jgi:hypothetical protein
MNKKQALKLLAKRKARAATKVFDISQFLFKEQLAFVTDPSRVADAVCSVRAGKTTACAADLINTAITMPGTASLYITLTFGSAERIIWPELKRINRDYALGFVVNQTKLTLTNPTTGSVIYLFGANNPESIEIMRGLSNVALIYLDECQSFRAHIRELVEEIAIKRLYDTNGRLRLIGTPGPVLAGYFYEASVSTRWPHHHWTLHNNPWLQKKSGLTADQLIAQDCQIKGVDITHPSIQRECFGRWVYDPMSLLLQYDKATNHFDELPPGEYQYILGIDLGVKDSDSLTLLAFSRTAATTYLVEEIVTPNQKTDDLANQIKSLMKKYPIYDMPTDAGGLGLKIVEDLKSRYGLPLSPADKREKMANYKHLNNALRTGIFKARSDTRFASDCNLLERNDNRSTPDRIVVKGHSDAVDSCLYAFKLSPAYAYVPPAPTLQAGTPEHLLRQEELHIEAAVAAVKKSRDLATGSASQMNTWSNDRKGIPSWNKW